MKRTENILLVGLLLLIIGVFLPWHGETEYLGLPINDTPQAILVIFTGFMLPLGKFILACAVGATLLTFLPKAGETGDRMWTAIRFLIGLVAALWLIGGVWPILFRGMVPRIGLFVIFAGITVSGLALKQKQQ